MQQEYTFAQFVEHFCKKKTQHLVAWKPVYNEFLVNILTAENTERTIASTETNDTSEESSDTQLFGIGKLGAWRPPDDDRPFSGGQIKAEIKGFLLRCRLFLY